ncbi:response regulator transcription factor [Paenibacillus alba]|uniref:Response regulator n=1 Tax=Paenibacillus alba TaxID=1197127 RepID=A0ABU6FX41_9BACL|nr:response regulator [Paenibacillus alba]MEC0226475.1 response regulator [Paenibacillus alba]
MPNQTKYRVLIVEDEPKIRRNIAQKIEKLDDSYQVVGYASNGEEGVSMIHELLPDVVFTDIKMPKMDGIQLIRSIKKELPEILFVILSGYNDFEYAKLAMQIGVYDYLLKPLTVDALDEILQKLRRSLQLKTNKMNRELLSSKINGLSHNVQASIHTHNEFIVLLICLGNLAAPITPPHHISFFQELWSNICFDTMLSRTLKGEETWFVIDEKACNQKFLLISADNRRSEEVKLIVQEISASLSTHVKQLPVTIAYSNTIMKHSDILEKAQQLRILLDRALVIGQSFILHCVKNAGKTTPVLMDQAFRNRISTCIQSGEPNSLKQALFPVFDNWIQARYPQRLLEKTISHLLQLINLQTGKKPESDLYRLEYDIYAQIATNPDPHRLFHDIWGVIENLVTIPTSEEDTVKVIEQIMTYLQLNYAKDINLEHLALKFHLTSSTFSKLVKKYYGETPLKYIIKLRIAEAKRLICENPQQEVWKIAEIVGYPDQHYFSRIFKHTTGLSPSEFKESILRHS